MTPISELEARQKKRVDNILVTQAPPKEVKTPFDNLINKYHLRMDYRAFTEVREMDAKGVRKQRVQPNEYTAVIFTSITAVSNYFRLMKDMGYKVHEDTKYFCLTEAIANNLSKYISIRRRKIFNGTRLIVEMKNAFHKHRAEKFLFPVSNFGAKDVTAVLTSWNIQFQECIMFETVSADIKDLEDVFYDILVFFTPQAIEALYENFPDFSQNETRIAVAGSSTARAAEERGLIVDIRLSTELTSMPQAIEAYMKISNA
jgi:uroporphyrinogen-III synthase